MSQLRVNKIKTKRVLVVDDVPLNRKMACLAINSLCVKARDELIKCEAEEATNGEEAVNRVSKSANQKPFAAILMDIEMPVKDGYEATQAILSLNQQLIVVAYTDIPKEECLKKQPAFAGYIGKGHIGDIGKVLSPLLLALDRSNSCSHSPTGHESKQTVCSSMQKSTQPDCGLPGFSMEAATSHITIPKYFCRLSSPLFINTGSTSSATSGTTPNITPSTTSSIMTRSKTAPPTT